MTRGLLDLPLNWQFGTMMRPFWNAVRTSSGSQLREAGQEFPIIVAASRGATECVQILVAYGQILVLQSRQWIAQDQGLLFADVRRLWKWLLPTPQLSKRYKQP